MTTLSKVKLCSIIKSIIRGCDSIECKDCLCRGIYLYRAIRRRCHCCYPRGFYSRSLSLLPLIAHALSSFYALYLSFGSEAFSCSSLTSYYICWMLSNPYFCRIQGGRTKFYHVAITSKTIYCSFLYLQLSKRFIRSYLYYSLEIFC